MINKYTKSDIENIGLVLTVLGGDIIIEAKDGTWMRYKQDFNNDYENNVSIGISKFLVQLRKEKLIQIYNS